MYAGIEAGGTKFVVAVGAGPDDLSESVRFPTTSPAETLERTADVVRVLAEGVALDAVGVASFGPVDLDRTSPSYGYITSTPKPGWRDTDVVGYLRRALGVPVGFDTDVNAAALAEHRWGAATGVPTSVYVTVGTGIGGGAVIDGQPLHGLLHPEMGHLTVRRAPDDEHPGSCPFHGDCLEGLAAGPAIEERWGKPAMDLGENTERAVRLEAWYLAQLITAIIYVLSPGRIVLAGGVIGMPRLLTVTRHRTVELLARYLPVETITERIDRYVVRPGLGDRSGVLGAIILATQAAASPTDRGG